VLLRDGSVLVMGGYTASSTYANGVWMSSDGGVKWKRLTSNAWSKGNYFFISLVDPIPSEY
jgi:hypothetical protein